ncbi:hypothetical protein Q5P01_012004 [Channa striata]|uniref:Uncharacterized protein n=1 Tax=Channa striata TaxID=64152 RepID=A0AA88MQW0_CHASR|nr:hypothetical protein Q5P01_012004 [Channa striata]
MPEQEHKITCVSLLIINLHLPKPGLGHHRKKLLVVYNKRKVNDELHPEANNALATGSGVKSTSRISFYPCSGELALLKKTVALLHHHGMELLYVYNAEFDVRVIKQRVHFKSNYAKGADATTRERCSALPASWDMLTSMGSVLSRGKVTEFKLRLSALHVEKFNKEKAKLDHFKMIGCGMTVVDLYRMAGTEGIKFARTTMKLYDVAPFVIIKDRELWGKPPKDPCKLADVAYLKVDEMIHQGGKSLFTVVV